MRKIVLLLTALASLTMAATSKAQSWGYVTPNYNGGYNYYFSN